MQQLPFVVGSDTSKAAAQSQVDKVGGDEAVVLARVTLSGDFGVTDDELEVVLDMSHQTASARRNGLVRKGLVCDSGRRRLTRSKRMATVWVRGRGTPLEGAPNARVARPSNEEIRAAMRQIPHQRLVTAGPEDEAYNKVIKWLTHISK